MHDGGEEANREQGTSATACKSHTGRKPKPEGPVKKNNGDMSTFIKIS